MAEIKQQRSGDMNNSIATTKAAHIEEMPGDENIEDEDEP